MDNKTDIFRYTVRDLIEILKDFPPDLPILTDGYETGYENLESPKIIKVKYEPDKNYYDGEFQEPYKEEQEVFEVVLIQRKIRKIL